MNNFLHYGIPGRTHSASRTFYFNITFVIKPAQIDKIIVIKPAQNEFTWINHHNKMTIKMRIFGRYLTDRENPTDSVNNVNNVNNRLFTHQSIHLQAFNSGVNNVNNNNLKH